MRPLLKRMCLALFAVSALGATREEWHKAYLAMIEKTKAEPTRENIMALVDQVAINDKYSHTMNPEGSRLNDRAREEICRLPGHAQYFADALEAERSKLKPGVWRGSYTDHVYACLTETLVHLPSPETVKVLGHYLNDDRDNPASPYPSDDYSYPGTSRVAFETLSKIGLRDLPQTDMHVEKARPLPGEHWTGMQNIQADLDARIAYYHKKDDALAAYRAWWAEVESGKRPFSFVGQKVEYRFKPDGTWETIAMANPPDDAPKPPQPGDRARKRTATGQNPTVRNVWPWMIGGTLAILAAVVWLGLRFRKPKPQG